MNKIEVGAMVGPASNVRVLAVADLGGSAVFLGRRPRMSDTPGMIGSEFIVSRFTLGATHWDNGFYTPNHETALSRFVNTIDDQLVVFAP